MSKDDDDKPIATAIGVALTAIVFGPKAIQYWNLEWTDKSPSQLALGAVAFVLFWMYLGVGPLPYPRSWRRWRKRLPRPASQRLALRRRRIGGTDYRLEQRLLIDADGIFETRLGLIPWPDIVGMRKAPRKARSGYFDAIQVCVRDPWRYFGRGTKRQAWGSGLLVARNARYGWIDVDTSLYRVDLDTAYEIATILRTQCPEPFIADAHLLMSQARIESRLGELEHERRHRRRAAAPGHPQGAGAGMAAPMPPPAAAAAPDRPQG